MNFMLRIAGISGIEFSCDNSIWLNIMTAISGTISVKISGKTELESVKGQNDYQ